MMQSPEELFSIKINICSGIIVSYLVHNSNEDLKAVFEISLEGQSISVLSIGKNEVWEQKSGQFLETEVAQVGAAIEGYYSKAFAVH
ncbi:hypothetical protein ACVWYG_001229 [Pedobacter sp. UYEF25]